MPNQIYDNDVSQLISLAYEGVKITCFAYGQTGSGKTFTMIGNDDSPGLYSLAVEDVFNLKKSNQRIFVSFYEIYCSNLYDLINKRKKLVLREDGQANVNVIGLLETEVSSAAELMRCVDVGDGNRITSTTNANYDSSRSHAILQIRISENDKPLGKLSFIDLAGNERGADADVKDKQTRLDGAEINKSLLALKECIRALDQGGKHTPFRGSKLTLVLKDSFIGNCRTIMIGNVSPSLSCCELTLNTLRYADRVKDLTNVKSSESKKQNAMMLARGNVKASHLTSEKNPNYKEDDEDQVAFIKAVENPKKAKQLNKVSSVDEPDRLNFRDDEPTVKGGKHTNNNPGRTRKNDADQNNMNSMDETAFSRNTNQADCDLDDDSGLDGNGTSRNPRTAKNNPKSMIKGKPDAPPAFVLLKKYFKKPISAYSLQELKGIHSKILDELADMRNSFLSECREYLDMMKANVRLEKEEIELFEEQSNDPEGYIRGGDSLLEAEKDMTLMVRENLSAWRRFIAEERLFTNQVMGEAENKAKQTQKAMTSKGFYHSSSTNVNNLKAKKNYESNDSLLLDED